MLRLSAKQTRLGGVASAIDGESSLESAAVKPGYDGLPGLAGVANEERHGCLYPIWVTSCQAGLLAYLLVA
jgi:hypothetical protein